MTLDIRTIGAPLLVIWFGIDIASKVVLAATLVFFLTFFTTLSMR
jgi:NitT/TauT family transport system permease protein